MSFQKISLQNTLLAAFITVSIVASGVAVFLFRGYQALEAEKIVLQKQVGELETTRLRADFNEALGIWMAGKFDELDKILLKTDTNSLNTIEWFKDHCFFGDDIGEANLRFGSWAAIQQQTTEDYLELKNEINTRLSEEDANTSAADQSTF